jgi:hypothetical protein
MPNGSAPSNIDVTGDFSAFVEMYYDGDFSFTIEQIGKQKTIVQPDGDVINTFPGLKATITNNETNETTRVNISGPVFSSTNEDGTTTFVGVGHQLNGDPFINGDGGIVLTTGYATWTMNGTDPEPVHPLVVRGGVTDLFDLF